MKLINLSLVLAAVIAASTTTTSDALSTKPTDRRKVFGLLAGGIAGSAFLASSQPASAVTLKTGGANLFTGDYNDPNHPDCLRQVKVVGSPLKGDGTRSPYPIIEVTGYDGKGSGSNICTDRPTRDDLWKVEGTVKSGDTAVSFPAFGLFVFDYAEVCNNKRMNKIRFCSWILSYTFV
jgi:hypothetical protein